MLEKRSGEKKTVIISLRWFMADKGHKYFFFEKEIKNYEGFRHCTSTLSFIEASW